MSMSADEAFEAYESVRPRLPDPGQGPARCREVETLADIAERFDVFLLDAFGVLNIGDTAIPGTRGRIDGLRRAGKRVLVVSNAASVPHLDLQQKYRRLGYDFSQDEIVTSRATMARSMAQSINGAGDLRWGAMTLNGSPLDDLGPVRTIRLGDDPQGYAEAEGFLLIGSGNWSDTRQSLLEDALRDRPRRVLVANPDIVAPREAGFSVEPGHYAHRLADRTGIEPEFYGKPFANIFDLAFDRLGVVDRARVLMVGDSLHTDILGARAAGIASALVSEFGFFAASDVKAAIRRSGIVPDFVLRRP